MELHSRDSQPSAGSTTINYLRILSISNNGLYRHQAAFFFSFSSYFFSPWKVFHFVLLRRCEFSVAVKFSDGTMLLRVIQRVMFRGFSYCLLKHAPVVVTGNVIIRDLQDIIQPSATIRFSITPVELFRSTEISQKSFL